MDRSAVDHIQLEMAIYIRAFFSIDDEIKKLTNENFSSGSITNLKMLEEERAFAKDELEKMGFHIQE